MASYYTDVTIGLPDHTQKRRHLTSTSRPAITIPGLIAEKILVLRSSSMCGKQTQHQVRDRESQKTKSFVVSSAPFILCMIGELRLQRKCLRCCLLRATCSLLVALYIDETTGFVLSSFCMPTGLRIQAMTVFALGLATRSLGTGCTSRINRDISFR